MCHRVNINKNNFVVNGNGHTIDCDNKARAFNITGKNVEINNIIIKNGLYQEGSAISSTENLKLNNVTFINCNGNGKEDYNAGAVPGRTNVNDNDLLKEALIKYGVVSVSHYADFNEAKYYNATNAAQYYYGNAKSANHRICLVGWDDIYSRYNFKTTPQGDGAWICKNSWGTNWGDEGYFYISYYDKLFARDMSVAYVLTNDTYNRIYQYDVGGEIVELKNVNYYFSNFTADADELIAAVGTYFKNPGDKYGFTIYVNDIPVYNHEGASTFGGYETIKLNKLIQIKKGDNFKIAFKNMLHAVVKLRIHTEKGHSFYSANNGTTYYDLGASNSVAILKAYTVSDLNITQNLVKYYGNDTPFVAEVDDGEEVLFQFGDKNYTVKSVNGSAKLKIDSDVGKYVISTTYKNMTIVNYIEIKSTIISNDTVRGINSNYDYKLQLLNPAGNPLNKTTVAVSLNNKPKNYTTDEMGYITIKFTKLTKPQVIKVVNPSNGDVKTSKITVVSRFVNPKNVAMYYYDGSKFTATILGDNGKAVGKNQQVIIKLNKQTYKVKTDAKGLISFKILSALKPGTYKLTATYKGESIKKTIKVKQNLKTSKYTIKKSAKKLTVKATLKNGKTAVKNKKITLSINGKKITAKTNKYGIAKFTIKKNVISKLKVGKKYTMKVTYLKNTIKTTLKVKR